MQLLRLAIPSPLRRYFDYLPPKDEAIPPQPEGCRVLVPFGRQKKVGFVVCITQDTAIETSKLRPAIEFIDTKPLLPKHLYDLGLWAANYYQHPIGDALFQMYPTLLRKGEQPKRPIEWFWRTTGQPFQIQKRAVKQTSLYNFIASYNPNSVSELDILNAEHAKATLKALADKGVIEKHTEQTATPSCNNKVEHQPPLTLNDEQAIAVDAINSHEGFKPFLLDGVTGSGKTEVYLQTIAHQLKQGKQALILIPEIGLTPQTVARFKSRFAVPICVLHSNLTDRARLTAWTEAKEGHAKIIIGTRSAIFTPMLSPGIIIIDEEHDASFKQQDGYRYHGRDLAVMRAHRENIPVILGSATPSFESLHNVSQGRYEHLRLRQRAGNAKGAPIELIDMCNQATEAGLAKQTVREIEQTLQKGEQVLVFINLRGYSPSLTCQDCGWIAECTRCDAKMTLHRRPAHLHCHHCEKQTGIPHTCPECHSPNLEAIGSGTERTEDWLSKQFLDIPVYRIDRDSTSRKGSLQAVIDNVHTGEPCILVGTQMLAKGHHFPDVTLVVIANADGGLFSADFRGMERTAQLIIQVAGRAGREEKSGKALLQTMHTDHPALLALVHQGYPAFAQTALIERKQMTLPPYSHYALLRAEASSPYIAERFLQDLRHTIEAQYVLPEQTHWLGPLPSPLERRAGMHRAQLIIYGQARKPLHQLLATLVEYLEHLPEARKIRWSLDIDPADTY